MDYDIIDEVGFRFDPRFGQLMGRQLISNPIVAVSELVKNSYDADADNIIVKFENLLNGISKLHIIDDGDGMSIDDIRDKWLVVGTDNKIKNMYTKRGRRKLGEKGIGRFSVERLARKLTIKTCQSNDSYAIMINIDWDKYLSGYHEFSEVKHKIYKIPNQDSFKGTELILEDLRDTWNEEDMLNLKKELNIIRPIDITQVSHYKYNFLGDDVKIKLVSADFRSKSGDINGSLIHYYQAHLFGEIKKNGTGEICVRIKPNISVSKKEIYKTFIYNSDELDTKCGPVVCEIFVFLKDQRLYRGLNIDRKDFMDLLEDFSGVKIYRDGFRIMPFGNPNNDWLELNSRRTGSPEYRISTGTSIGIVYISRDNNPGLQDVLSRENMYNTQEFTALKDFVRRIFDKYTSLQLAARNEKNKINMDEGKVLLNEAEKSIKTLTQNVSTIQQRISSVTQEINPQEQMQKVIYIGNDLSKLVSSAETSLASVKYAYTHYKKQNNFRSRETQIYRNIATLGISAAMFGHEAINQATHAKVTSDSFYKRLPLIINDLDKLRNLFDTIYKDICSINEKTDFFRSYLRRDKQDRARYIDIVKSLETILRQYTNAFITIDVKATTIVNIERDSLRTWGYEGDFDTIFTNLITNAYKAMKKEYDNKFLRFEFEYQEPNIIIYTSNNGKPIEQKDREFIFDPLFSTYSEGTGLGLTIVKDTLLNYNGSIDLCNDYPITKFKITIPRQKEPSEE